METKVLAGLVSRNLRAFWPTTTPSGWTDTSEGVIGLPRSLGTTTGWSLVRTARHELVVPRSIPALILSDIGDSSGRNGSHRIIRTGAAFFTKKTGQGEAGAVARLTFPSRAAHLRAA